MVTLAKVIRDNWIPTLKIYDDMLYFVPTIGSPEFNRAIINMEAEDIARVRDKCLTYKSMDVHNILRTAEWSNDIIAPDSHKKLSGRMVALQQRLNKSKDEAEYPEKERIEKAINMALPLFKGDAGSNGIFNPILLEG